jgi:prophage regulatory protein
VDPTYSEFLAPAQDGDALLRRRTVEERTTLSKSEMYRRIKAKRFPAPLKIGTRAARWRASDIARWIAEQGERVAA